MHWILFMAWHNFFTSSQKSIAFTFSPTASSVIFIVKLHLTSTTKVYGLCWSMRFWKLRRYLHSILVLHELANLNTFLIFCGDTVLLSGSLTQNFTETHFLPFLAFFLQLCLRSRARLRNWSHFLSTLNPWIFLHFFRCLWKSFSLTFEFANLENAFWFNNGIVFSRMLLCHSKYSTSAQTLWWFCTVKYFSWDLSDF